MSAGIRAKRTLLRAQAGYGKIFSGKSLKLHERVGMS